ncbi:MAG: hypothetical protein RH982_02105, partial [Parvibaculum sp.]
MLSRWRRVAFLIACVSLVMVGMSAAAHADARWRITKERWSESDEKAWQDFVAALGATDCWTFDE